MDVTKVCSCCKIPKELNDFYRSKSGKFGIKAICKICERDKVRLYYQNNADKLKKYSREYSKNNRNIINNRLRKKYQTDVGYRTEFSLTQKLYYEDNKVKKIKKQKRYYKKNREKRINYHKEYYKKNKEKVLKSVREYRRNRL